MVKFSVKTDSSFYDIFIIKRIFIGKLFRTEWSGRSFSIFRAHEPNYTFTFIDAALVL